MPPLSLSNEPPVRGRNGNSAYSRTTGLSIEKVALVTGHKDWRTLRRYTKLKPEELHKLQTALQPTLEEFIQKLTKSEFVLGVTQQQI
jgi:hypothetical protein